MRRLLWTVTLTASLLTAACTSSAERSLQACASAAGAALPPPADVARRPGTGGACLLARATKSSPYTVTVECRPEASEAECVARLERVSDVCAAAFFDGNASCADYPDPDRVFFR